VHLEIKAFNFKTMLISIPQLILPVLYWLGSKYGNANIGLAIVAAVGILGLALKGKGFSQIEKSINQRNMRP
jgi:hypothetical protein